MYMSMELQATAIQVTAIGAFASELLASTRRVEVVASFSQALYYRTSQNELGWITGTESPLHRRCLQISTPLPRLPVGTILAVHDGWMEVEPTHWLDFSQSSTWESTLPHDSSLCLLTDLHLGINSVCQHFMTQNPPAGLGVLIPTILARMQAGTSSVGSSQASQSSSPILQAAEKVITALHEKDYHGLPRAAMSMIGLGEGLTPSGDDFLGGLFFAWRCLDQVHPVFTQSIDWNYSEFIMQCRHLTNEISFTLLRDHSLGHTLQPLVEIARGLMAGLPGEHLLPPARELMAVGHSTGWDLLTGFLAGLSSSSTW